MFEVRIHRRDRVTASEPLRTQIFGEFRHAPTPATSDAERIRALVSTFSEIARELTPLNAARVLRSCTRRWAG